MGEKFIYENMREMHKQQSNSSIQTAQNRFCTQLSANDSEYAYNLHLYNVYKNKQETPASICLAISPKGILVFQIRDTHEISLISTFNWSSVYKLNAHVNLN